LQPLAVEPDRPDETVSDGCLDISEGIMKARRSKTRAPAIAVPVCATMPIALGMPGALFEGRGLRTILGVVGVDSAGGAAAGFRRPSRMRSSVFNRTPES
jgi:hypothetical protein